MKILYHIPSLDTIYATRHIYNGYRNAFLDMGHEFLPFTASDKLEEKLVEYNPDIFITSLHGYYLKGIDLIVLNKFRKKGLTVFCTLPFWKSPISKLRLNEAPSLHDHQAYVNLLKGDDYADIYFNPFEQDDPRNDAFTNITRKN